MNKIIEASKEKEILKLRAEVKELKKALEDKDKEVKRLIWILDQQD